MEEFKEIDQLLKDISFIHFKKMYPELKKLGIHPGQEFFLKYILENNGLSQRQLATLTKRESATITKAIQRLEHAGYIERKIDDHDKRIFHIYITEDGRKIYEKVQKLKEEQNKLFDQFLNEEDKINFYNILCKIKKGLKEGETINEENI